ncbi:MAG TPA: hypothetical protein VF680_17180 [Allosphingosinicella sp.]|jgi:hypothetical protein
MKKINNITLGCDPELFLERDGEIVSAIGLIGGSKDEPKPISEKGHAIQEDNVLMEFCIPPAKTVEEFTESINFVKNHLTIITAAMGCKPNYSASAILAEKELDSDKAKEFGCDPDFNVYTQGMNEPPNAESNMRSAGGHIHIGFDKSEMTMEEADETVERLVKAMDMTVGLKSLALDKDDRRKELYGKAGCFRFKPYGMEYRTPSNFWIATDELIAWAWNTTYEAINLVNSGLVDELSDKYSEQIVKAINENNKSLAIELLEKIGEYSLQVA